MSVYKRTVRRRGNRKKNWEIGDWSDCKFKAGTHHGTKFTGGKAPPHQRHIGAILAFAQWQWKNNEVTNGRGGDHPAFQPGISILHRKHAPSRTELNLRELPGQVVGQVVASVPIAQEMGIESNDHSLARGSDLRQNPDKVLELYLKSS